MLPRQIKSLWTATTPQTNYGPLKPGVEVDIVIIGAGIAGLNAAYFLVKENYKVAIIDSQRIATGTSGNTTAKITSQHFLRYAYLKNKFGFEKAKIYADSNEWAITAADAIIKDENINCDFTRLPAYVYSQTNEGAEKIKKEVEIAKQLGLPASFVINIENLLFPITGAIKFDNQAYFHPRKYLLALAEIIKQKGGMIFEETPALDIIEKEKYIVVTPTCNISATYVIIATNLPFKNKTSVFKSLHTSPSYVLATKLNRPAPDGMFIAIDGNKLTFRPHRSGDEEWFLVGESSEAGIEESADRFERIEKIARENFDIKEIDFKWAAEDTLTPDEIPVIGKIPKTKSLFVTTGYNKWGMTTSFVSAQILTDLIAGRPNDWAASYSPDRLAKTIAPKSSVAPRPSAVIPAKAGIKELLKQSEIQDLKPDTGKVISYKDQKIAIYKDPDGNLHARSAICTHLGCTIGWNNKDKTWDCPCHGSRFDKDGNVIHGPAERPLKEVEIDD